MAPSLPLTPFEELMLYQDSRAHPATCFFRLRFQGHLQPGALRAAACSAISRHPLFNATVDVARGGPCWRLWEENEPEILWREEGKERSPVSANFDLRSRPGLRLVVQEEKGSSELMIQFHHAVCDGLGLCHFTHDLLVAYANATGGKEPSIDLPGLDHRLLLQRGSLRLDEGLVRAIRRQAVGLLGVRQFLMRRPQPVLPHEPEAHDAWTPADYPALRVHHFSAETSMALKEAARTWGVTLNDLLARDLFIALHEFREDRQLTRPEHWLRLMIPMNLRNASDRGVPAANIVSSVFLDRRAADIADPQRLLASVKDEMDLIKRLGLSRTFILSLHAQRWLPGGLRAAARSRSCRTSAVLTNLGKIFHKSPLRPTAGRLQCGDVCLDELAIAAPLAPYMCAAFAILSYANRLTITLHHDSRVLPPPAAAELLNRYVQRMMQSAGMAASTNPVDAGSAQPDLVGL